MALIITAKTDTPTICSGWCSNCGGYNEVLSQKKYTRCKLCMSKMYHIGGYTVVIGLVVMSILIKYML